MYTPQVGEEGLVLLKSALRSYLIADLSAANILPVVDLLASGADGFIDEGLYTQTTPTPVIQFITLGDDTTDGPVSHVRFLLYVIDKGRGLSEIERILARLRARLLRTELALHALTFPPGVSPVVVALEVRGTTDPASLPAWKAEARGIDIILTVYGWQSDAG